MPTVYIETSIVSYLTARPSRDVVTLARQELTREWWNSRRQRHDLFTSDVVVGEASEGDDEAARQRLDALQGIEELETTPEAEDLASALLEKGPLPERQLSMPSTSEFLRLKELSTSSHGIARTLPMLRCENQ